MPACDSKDRQPVPLKEEPPLSVLVVLGLSVVGLGVIFLPIVIFAVRTMFRLTCQNWFDVWTLFYY